MVNGHSEDTQFFLGALTSFSSYFTISFSEWSEKKIYSREKNSEMLSGGFGSRTKLMDIKAGVRIKRATVDMTVVAKNKETGLCFLCICSWSRCLQRF